MIDLLVAGGGPAGLATAVHAARSGLEVVVAEPRATPVDKARVQQLLDHYNALAHASERDVLLPIHNRAYFNRKIEEAAAEPGPASLIMIDGGRPSGRQIRLRRRQGRHRADGAPSRPLRAGRPAGRRYFAVSSAQ